MSTKLAKEEDTDRKVNPDELDPDDAYTDDEGDSEDEDELDAEEDCVILTDDDGKDVTLLVRDHFSREGHNYAVLSDIEDEDSVMVFEEETDENGEVFLAPIEDDDLEEELFDRYQAAADDYEFTDAE